MLIKLRLIDPKTGVVVGYDRVGDDGRWYCRIEDGEEVEDWSDGVLEC